MFIPKHMARPLCFKMLDLKHWGAVLVSEGVLGETAPEGREGRGRGLVKCMQLSLLTVIAGEGAVMCQNRGSPHP